MIRVFVGMAIICVGVLAGGAVGMAIGDRKSQWLDFGTHALAGFFTGALVGGLAGAVVALVVTS